MEEITEEKVKEVLRENVIVPEMGINIVDMGLVYQIEIDEGAIAIDIMMISGGYSHTSRLAGVVEQAIKENFEREVEVAIIDEPRWTPEKLSEDLKKNYGLDGMNDKISKHKLN